MYFCNDCGNVFGEPKYKKEYQLHDELDEGNKYEEINFAYCPSCGSDDIETADHCELTGEYGNYGGKNLSPEAIAFIREWLDKMTIAATEDYRMDISTSDMEDYVADYLGL